MQQPQKKIDRLETGQNDGETGHFSKDKDLNLATTAAAWSQKRASAWTSIPAAEKEYLVRIDKPLSEPELAFLRGAEGTNGVRLDGR